MSVVLLVGFGCILLSVPLLGLVLFLLGLVKAVQVTVQQVGTFFLRAYSLFVQGYRFLSLFVHLDDFFGSFRTDGHQIGGESLVGRVGDHAGQDICFEEEVVLVLRLQDNFPAWNPFAGFHVIVHLIVETAFQFGTHASQFLWIQ